MREATEVATTNKAPWGTESRQHGGDMSTGKIIGYIVAGILVLFGVLWLLSAFIQPKKATA